MSSSCYSRPLADCIHHTWCMSHTVLLLPAANLKLTFPTAIALQQLAWSLVASPDVYNDAGLSLRARDNLAWAADYLVACRAQGNNSLITQVGPSSWQAGCWEHQHWPRPMAAELLKASWVKRRHHAALTPLPATAATLQGQEHLLTSW